MQAERVEQKVKDLSGKRRLRRISEQRIRKNENVKKGILKKGNLSSLPSDACRQGRIKHKADEAKCPGPTRTRGLRGQGAYEDKGPMKVKRGL